MIRAYPQELLKQAAAVSVGVQLREVVLKRLTFNYNNPTGNCKIKLDTNGVLLDTDEDRLRIVVSFKLTLLDEEKDIEHLRLEGAFQLLYDLASQKRPEDENLAAFAEINAVFNAWPYLRELIGSVSNRAGLIPTLMLPSLHIGVKKS